MKIEHLDFAALNSLDFGVIFVILASMFFAFMRGFISSLLSLTGWILAILLSYQLFPYAKPYIGSYIKSDLFVMIIGHTVLLLLLLVVFAIFNTMISTFMLSMQRGAFDRMLGLIFGFFRGSLIISFFFLCFTIMANLISGNKPMYEKDDAIPSTIKNAQFYPFLKVGSHFLTSFFPVSIEDSLKFIADNLGEKGVEDRFTATAIRKLYQHLDESELDEIEQNAINIDEVQLLKQLKDTYVDKVQKGQITEDFIPKEELDRMQQVIDRNNSNSKMY